MDRIVESVCCTETNITLRHIGIRIIIIIKRRHKKITIICSWSSGTSEQLWKCTCFQSWVCLSSKKAVSPELLKRPPPSEQLLSKDFRTK